MPVLRRNDEVETFLNSIDDRDDLIAFRDRQGAAGHEIVLDVDKDERTLHANGAPASAGDRLKPVLHGQTMTTIVLFGGPSDERHVSVASAQNVVRALGNPLAWFWAPDGPVHDVAVDDLLAHQRPFEIDFQPRRPAIWPNIEQALDTLPVDDPVFLLALHGTAGEDGTLQRMMEQRGIAFTG